MASIKALNAQAEYNQALADRARVNAALEAVLARLHAADLKVEATHQRMIKAFTEKTPDQGEGA